MIRNKKGLSTVVTTLIIILLVLVAVSIVWVVVRAFIESGVETIDYTAKCLQVDVRATAVTGTNPYDVTLKRGAGGEAIAGIRFVFLDAGTGSGMIDDAFNIQPLATETRTVDGGISDAIKVEVTPYFIDANGNQQFCGGQTNTFSF